MSEFVGMISITRIKISNLEWFCQRGHEFTGHPRMRTCRELPARRTCRVFGPRFGDIFRAPCPGLECEERLDALGNARWRELPRLGVGEMLASQASFPKPVPSLARAVELK